MRWSEVDFHPSTTTLRQFAALWLAFFGGLAVWGYGNQAMRMASGVAGLAILGGLAGFIKPALLRPIYVGWMVLVFPLGWAVSHLMLAVIFFGLFTPLALVFRRCRRDALSLRARPGLATYWTAKPAAERVSRYFRPF
jgi:Saxitoxin biosynthesis operon protein SxtJ